MELLWRLSGVFRDTSEMLRVQSEVTGDVSDNIWEIDEHH
jgi:hypothetical protein